MDAETLKAVAELIDALAWPAVILLFVLTHRPVIGRLLDNLESFSLPGGIEGKIRHQLNRETRQILKALPQSASCPNWQTARRRVSGWQR